MSKNHPGFFLTIEGIEGVGKTTSLALIQEYLKEKNIPFLVTREPGGTAIAEAIRQVLLNHHEETMTDMAELLLLFAGRAQHIASVIEPALQKGQWVLCDRFTDASYAYQGAGRGIPSDRIAALEKWTQGDLQPQATLLLDAPVNVALARAKQRGKQLDRIENEHHLFFERVRQCYLSRAQEYPKRYRVIDAEKPYPVVTEQLHAVMQALVDEWKKN